VKLRSLVLACLALAALAVAAVAREDDKKDKGKGKAAVYKTPQAVFDARVKAEKDDDYETLVNCYTPDFQRRFVHFFGLIAAGRADLTKKDDEKSKKQLKEYKPLYDALDKHGLTAEAYEKLRKDAGKDAKKFEKGLDALIKDPAAFVVDVAKGMKKVEAFSRNDKAERKLSDVKIDGDKASGTLTRTTTTKTKDKDKENVKTNVRKSTITFEKVDGSWRIDDEDKKEEKMDK